MIILHPHKNSRGYKCTPEITPMGRVPVTFLCILKPINEWRPIGKPFLKHKTYTIYFLLLKLQNQRDKSKLSIKINERKNK